MNSIMERWIGRCRRELLDRTLIWNQRHLMTVLREYEDVEFSDRLKIDLYCDLVFHVACMSVTYACARKPCHRPRGGSHELRKMTGISAAGWTGGLCSLGSVSSGRASNSSGIQVAGCLRRNKVLVPERA